jgi:hypothetical protein
MRNDKALRKNLEMPGHKKDLGVPPNRHTPLGVGCCVSSPLPNASLSGSGLYTAPPHAGCAANTAQFWDNRRMRRSG